MNQEKELVSDENIEARKTLLMSSKVLIALVKDAGTSFSFEGLNGNENEIMENLDALTNVTSIQGYENGLTDKLLQSIRCNGNQVKH